MTQEIEVNMHMRKELAQRAIWMLENEVDDSDPRKEVAIKRYKDQLAEIERRIEQGANQPKDVVIGLKPGRLKAKRL